MSVVAARSSSGIAEQSTWWLFSSTAQALFSPKAAYSKSLALQLHQPAVAARSDTSLWLWTAVGLSVVGFKLCSDALEFYKFCAAWNRVWRRTSRWEDFDMDVRRKRSEKHMVRRKRQLERALATLTFGQVSKLRLFGSRGERNPYDEDATPLRANRSIETCPTPLASTTDSSTTSTSSTLVLDKTCAICLEEFQLDDKVSCSKQSFLKGSCKHIFHKECLQSWLMKHSSCPTCRHRMVPDPEPCLVWSSSVHR